MANAYRARKIGHFRGRAVLGALLLFNSHHGVHAQEPVRVADARGVPEPLRFANALLRDRRYDVAATQYERFLKTSPDPTYAADAHFGLGRARLFLNDYPAAHSEFQAFLRIAPADHPNIPTALFRLGESAYLMNDLAAARKSLEDYTARYPEHTHRDTAWPELADVCVRLNDLPAAKVAYQKAIQIEPVGRLANRSRFHLGRTLAALGEPEEAIKLLSALADANDAEWSGKARLLEAQVLLSSGKVAEAIERFEALERLKPPGVAPAEARLRRADALIKLDRRDEADALLAPLVAEGSKAVAPPAAFALASSQLDQGKAAEALATCDGVLKRTPGSPWSPRILYRSAEALARSGDASAARERFLKVASDFPKDAWSPAATLRAARIDLDGSDPAAALALTSRFADRYPASPLKGDASLISARASLALNHPKDAVTILDRLLAEDKLGQELALSVKYYLALSHKADGQPAKALELLVELAKMGDSPTSADAKLVVGFAHYEAKQFADAADAFQGYLDTRPRGDDAPRALAYLALSRQELGQSDGAAAALARLAKDWPASDALPRTRLILAEAAFDAKRYEDAQAAFRAVLDGGDPKWKVRALSGLGWAQLQGGKPIEAAASFADLLSSAPADPLAADAALGRARALEAADKDGEALAALAVVVDDYPKSPQFATARLARARLLGKMGKAGDAADELKGLLQAVPSGENGSPSGADLLVEWGWLLHDAGKTADADAAFRRVLDEHKDSPRTADARVFLAESFHASGKIEEAAALLEPVADDGAQADPLLVQTALLRLGRIDLARGDAAKAGPRFDRLLKDFPDGKFRVEAEFGKADADLKLGKVAAAEARFAAIAKESGPDALKWVPAARLRQIQALGAQEKWAAALAAADALKAENPSSLNVAQTAELDYARGRSLAAEARFDDARAAYQASIDAQPGSETAAKAQLMRGETYFHQKNYDEALREFHQTDLSYKAPEWQAAALLEAGKVYELTNRWTDAVDVYEKIRKSFPKDARIAEVERRLAEAKKNVNAPPPVDAPPADK